MSSGTDFQKQNSEDWKKLIKQLFPKGVPFRARWVDQASIVAVLSHLGSVESVNYLFFPRGGGLVLTGASPSHEEGCIELHFGNSRYICQVAALTFESFGDQDDKQWAYFRLQLEPLEGLDVASKDAEGYQEQMTELHPGRYVTPMAWEEREYRGERLPEKARPLTRLLKGNLVLFQKMSFFNLVTDSYSQDQKDLSEDQLRELIGRMREANPGFAGL